MWAFVFQERKQLLGMMDQEHQTELNEEEFLLKLEQDEETENLRKVCVLNHIVIRTTLSSIPSGRYVSSITSLYLLPCPQLHHYTLYLVLNHITKLITLSSITLGRYVSSITSLYLIPCPQSPQEGTCPQSCPQSHRYTYYPVLYPLRKVCVLNHI